MTTTRASCQQADPSIPSSFASAIWMSVSDLWRRWVQDFARAQRNRRDVDILLQLDDHQLKDIGLTRGQIEAFVERR